MSPIPEYNKEAIYDEQISPLMAQIIKICADNGIQMLASFALMDADPNYNDEPMLVTTCMPGDTYNNPKLLDARKVIYNPAPAFTAALTIRNV